MTINQTTMEQRAQIVSDAMGKFIMLWAADELMDQVASAPDLHGDIAGSMENLYGFQSGFLLHRAGLAD